MERSIVAEIARLQRMSVAELQAEWFKLYGTPSRSRNRVFLWKRLAWRVQELRLGGLSNQALTRIDELAPDGFEPARTPASALPHSAQGSCGTPLVHRRDPSLPSPGSILAKCYKGQDLRVAVRDDGYELDGTIYPSLTAAAKAVTGSTSINGRLFFGLTGRKR